MSIKKSLSIHDFKTFYCINIIFFKNTREVTLTNPAIWNYKTKHIMYFSDFLVGHIGDHSVEDCAMFLWNKSYKWGDNRCSSKLGAVCESS